MRTRIALLAALLLAPPGVLHARQAPPAPPAPVAPAPPAPPERADRVLTGDRTVEAGEVVDDIVVVGGDLRVRGEVTGDAVVVGGSLILEEDGLVGGDAVVTGGRIVDEGGRVRGEMRVVDSEGGELADEIKRAVSEGISAAEAGRGAAAGPREEMRRTHRVIHREREARSWWDPIRKGLAGLISTLALGLVLAGIGAVLVFYGRPYLETVSDTLRGSTLRSGAVGLAAGILALPAFVVLVVALAVSIVGIPLLLVAIPLYPLAVAAALAFGLLAAAHAIGERTAEQRSDGLDLRNRNSYAYLFTGLGMMIAPLAAAYLIGMTGFLGFLGTLLKVVMAVVIWAVAVFGFGAVILSRGGTRRSFVAPLPDAGYEADPFFDREPGVEGPHA